MSWERILKVPAVLYAMLIPLASGWPAAAQTAGDPAGSFRIRSAVNADACMHKRSPGWDNGNIVHLWSCEAGSSENKDWTFEPATGLIRSAVNPAMCMHKKFRGWENGNPIHLWRCDAGSAEMKLWVFNRSTGRIASAVNPNVCMHKRSPGFENGNLIHLWDCAAGGTENTSWAFDDGVHVGLTQERTGATIHFSRFAGQWVVKCVSIPSVSGYFRYQIGAVAKGFPKLLRICNATGQATTYADHCNRHMAIRFGGINF
jgi:hypothetical protein